MPKFSGSIILFFSMHTCLLISDVRVSDRKLTVDFVKNS